MSVLAVFWSNPTSDGGVKHLLPRPLYDVNLLPGLVKSKDCIHRVKCTSVAS